MALGIALKSKKPVAIMVTGYLPSQDEWVRLNSGVITSVRSYPLLPYVTGLVDFWPSASLARNFINFFRSRSRQRLLHLAIAENHSRDACCLGVSSRVGSTNIGITFLRDE